MVITIMPPNKTTRKKAPLHCRPPPFSLDLLCTRLSIIPTTLLPSIPIPFMASVQETNSNSKPKGLRRLLLLRKEVDRSPLISSSPPREEEKKKGLALGALRGLGCASATQAYAPAAAAVRSSADWQGKRPRKRRVKQRKRKERPSSVAADVCCAPGIGFAAADVPVDCVVVHEPAAGRGRPEPDRAPRERSLGSRRGSNQERISSLMDSPSDLETAFFGSDLLPPGHLRRMRGYHRSPGGLEEIMLFQSRMILGGTDLYDRYRDLRLDVDNMSYEELLELGDRIGHVSTGLREEEIFHVLQKMKRTIFDVSPLHFATETEWKCSICQEEYEMNDEVGSLDCGHSYHIYCIKQWLLRKNACPVCKTTVKS